MNGIKKLGKALGIVGNALGVIGRVSKLENNGRTVIEIGHGYPDGTWEKITDGGHIVLQPAERERLIKVLESHREYKVIELGDTVALSFTVIAVQYLNASADGGRLQGTILAYSEHKREWAVLTADPYGEVRYGTYTSDQQRALIAYITRVNEHLFPHFNVRAPYVTFAPVAERNRLKA